MKYFARILATSAALFLLHSGSVAQVPVYSNDFESLGGPEWSLDRRDTTPTGRKFLGRFANDQTVTLSLGLGSPVFPGGLPSHSSVTISFDLFIIHSWDGANFGEDLWSISVQDGPLLLRTTFANPLNGTANNPQNYPGSYPDDVYPARTGADEVDTLGYLNVTPKRFGDTVYNLTFTFPHTADSLAFDFAAASAIVAGVDNESWGLDNLTVAIVPDANPAVTMVDFDTPVRVLVPTDDSLGLGWTSVGFDDSTWLQGPGTPVGYGYSGALVEETDIRDDMLGNSPSAFLRIDFDLGGATPQQIAALNLQMFFDDGFVAYLNGTRIASDNVPSGALSWDAVALENREAQPTDQNSYDLSGYLNELLPGDNTLAIHGLNFSSSGSDFLIAPVLTATIDPLPATVALTEINHVYDRTPKAATATTSPPGLAVTITYDGDPTPPSSAGTYEILAEIDELLYEGSAIGTLTIARASQQITFDAIPDKTMGDAPFPLSASSTSDLGVSFAVVAGTASVSGSTLTITGAGDVTVRALQTGNSNYLPALAVERTFTVASGNQTIDFQALAARTFGDAPFTPPATASSGLPVSFEVVGGPATSSGSTVTLTGAGSVTLRASQAGNAAWNPAPPVEQTFTVVRAPQTISFPAVADRAFDAAPFAPAATSGSGLPVTLAVVSGPASSDGATVSLTGAGTVTLRASQAGDANYLPAADVERSFVAGYSLALQPTAGGTISASPARAIYAPGEAVALTANESAAHRFTGWGGALAGTHNPANLTMDAHNTVTAEFKHLWTLDVTSGIGGSVSVSPDKAEYLHGTLVTLTPVPDVGYKLTAWGGDASGADDPLVLTLNADTAVSASFDDGVGPTVQIFSPGDGTTNNQFTALFGTVSDNDSVTSVRWERDGAPAGALDFAGGTFNVTGLVLNPGDNSFEVFATDPAGNEGSHQVVATWQPDRTLSLSGPPETREGKLVAVPVALDSGGNVGGMTFVLSYDPQFLGSPEVILTGPAAGGINQINTATPGEVRVTFALPATTLPAGPIDLATVTFRARSVPFDLTTFFGLDVIDVSGADAQQITFGTHSAGGEARLLQRTHTGDINTNDRLDTGDAFLMQRMLAGIDVVRTWDNPLNDLNDSSVLDSGDVIGVLRTIVGIDPQPGAPQGLVARAAKRTTKGSPTEIPGPTARLTFDKDHAAAGEQVKLQVVLEDVGYAPPGASFTLDYPADALRLTDASSHQPGAVVPGSSLVLWNVAPSQNDYAAQTGSVGFVASSSAPWPGAEAGGVLAEFTFEVQPGASAQPVWDIRLEAGELPSGDGFSVVELPDTTATFIGQATTFSGWIEPFLEPGQVGDPTFDAPNSDGEHDGMQALAEYGTGSHPMQVDPQRGPRARVVQVGGQEFAAIEFDLSLTAVDVTHKVQVSDDLADWAGTDTTNSALFSRSRNPDGRTDTLVVRDLQPLSAGTPARAFRVLFELDGE